MAKSILTQYAARGEFWGLFAPDYKILSETYRDLERLLQPITEHSNKTEGLIRLATGGRIDFWTLNNPRAGRSRKYHGVIVDEAAFAGPDMPDIWSKAIEPTLLDYCGGAWAMSTPNGQDTENWFYQICTDKSLGWKEFHAPTASNPFLPAGEIERLRRVKSPPVFLQEHEAEFVDWKGTAFFAESSLLDDGKPYVMPERTDMVYAVIDTAMKDGKEHDGTAVVYFARNKISGAPLVVLDWDVLEIKSNLLSEWLPNVYRRLEDLSARYKARHGSAGAWIEDKASGITLLQHAQKTGGNASALPAQLTAMGKDGRALNVSGYVYQGQVKVAEEAYNKVTNYKGQTRNHLISQVCGFRVGEKNAHQMDLLDCFTYGVAIGLGNSDGY
ncbi:MAG: hypothetical protein KGL35_29220 [Bradyrhizobium sp.]|nr:hypothetical protein [Bradyrhizobium sp.]